MDADHDLLATGTKETESLNLEDLRRLLDKLNPQFKCEICLHDRFGLQPAELSAPCLPYYDLKNPSSAVGVRFCIALTCLTCGNAKLLDLRVLQARLANEG